MVNTSIGKDDRRRATDSLVDKDDWRELREEIREGFKGVYERQDRTNGRLGIVEQKVAGHVVKIDDLRSEERRRHNARRSNDHPPDDGKKLPVSQRDVALVLGTAGTGWAIVKALAWIVPFLK